MNQKSNIITLFVVKGCEACKIAENLINKAIKQSNKTIELDIVDISDIHNDFTGLVRKYLIDDCPTIIFDKDGLAKEQIIGTRTVDELVALINKHF